MLEERVTELEQELGVLKHGVQDTLLALQQDLGRSAPRRPNLDLHRRAWVMALLNMTLAITLFTNMDLGVTARATETFGSSLATWARSLWMGLAFVWLVLQLYPLALLIEAGENELGTYTWRNAGRLILSNPALVGTITCGVLLIAVTSALYPQAWIWLMVGALAFVLGSTVGTAVVGRRH